MGDNRNWVNLMLLIFIQFVMLPFTGISMILREDSGVFTKTCGWVLLFLGIMLWIGILGL